MFKYFLPLLALSAVLMVPPISFGYPAQPGQASTGYSGNPGYGPAAVTSDGSVIHTTPDKTYVFPNPDEGMYFDNAGIGSPYGYLPDTATSSVDFDVVDCDYCVGIGGQEVPSDLFLSRQQQQAQGHYNQPDTAPPPGYPGAGSPQSMASSAPAAAQQTGATPKPAGTDGDLTEYWKENGKPLPGGIKAKGL